MLQRLIFLLIVLGLSVSQAQGDNQLAARATTTDELGQLESLGVQVLSGILSPSTASATTSSTSSSSSTSTTSTSSSSTSSTSTTSSTSSTSSDSTSLSSSLAQAASSSAASPAALSTVNKENTRHRNIAIIVGSVLGFVVLLLLLALLWFCCFSKRGRRGRRRGRGRGVAGEKTLDDDEEEPMAWGAGGPEETTYVTRIESWHEPRGSRNSSRGPPKGSQSRVSLVTRDLPAERHNAVPPMQQRDMPERYNTGPSTQVPAPIPPPHRTSSYGLIQNESPFEDPRMSYNDRPERHSMDDAARERSRYPGYAPYRASQSTHSLVADRSPTPLFGSGRTPGENGIKRKSIGSGPTAVDSKVNSTDPSPPNGNSAPWAPPRARRKESLPGSPLAHEFEFGFGEQPRRLSRERQSMPGGWSSYNSIADAHQRF